ncbi:hypothetical protein K469DRAFT_550278, partial [Zopfia rhizophila CBS 207.26]
FLYSLINKIEDSLNLLALILKYFYNNILYTLVAKKLTSLKVKYIIRKVLKVLVILYKNNYIHTDIKSNNVLINYRPKNI